MQPVTDNRLQQQVIPAQQRISGQRETSSPPVKTTPHGVASVFPEDVVNLSTDRSLNVGSAVKKMPSIPMTNIERKALQESFSVYA